MKDLHPHGAVLKYEDVLMAYRAHNFKHSPLLEPVDIIQQRLYAWGMLMPGEFLVDYDTVNEWFRLGVYDNSIQGKSQKKLTWKDKVKKFINEHL